jgi:hypothetical protein
LENIKDIHNDCLSERFLALKEPPNECNGDGDEKTEEKALEEPLNEKTEEKALEEPPNECNGDGDEKAMASTDPVKASLTADLGDLQARSQRLMSGEQALSSGLLARARGLKRNISNTSTPRSSSRMGKCPAFPRMDVASDGDDWDNELGDDGMQSCQQSMSGASSAKLGFGPRMQQSPQKVGTTLSRMGSTPPTPSAQPDTSRRRAMPPPPSAIGGGRGSKGGGRGRGGKVSLAVPPGFCKCTFCSEVLPVASFNAGRKTCIADDNAIESLQRLLRKRWKANYKQFMKKTKDDKPRWVQAVIAFRMNNKGRKRRVIGGGKDTLAELSQKSKRKRHCKGPVRKMTYQAFCVYYAAPEHGGYDEEGLRNKWSELTDNVAKVDNLGVVTGVAGHSRWRIRLEDMDESQSEDVSEDIRQHKHDKDR